MAAWLFPRLHLLSPKTKAGQAKSQEQQGAGLWNLNGGQRCSVCNKEGLKAPGRARCACAQPNAIGVIENKLRRSRLCSIKAKDESRITRARKSVREKNWGKCSGSEFKHTCRAIDIQHEVFERNGVGGAYLH